MLLFFAFLAIGFCLVSWHLSTIYSYRQYFSYRLSCAVGISVFDLGRRSRSMNVHCAIAIYCLPTIYWYVASRTCTMRNCTHCCSCNMHRTAVLSMSSAMLIVIACCSCCWRQEPALWQGSASSSDVAVLNLADLHPTLAHITRKDMMPMSAAVTMCYKSRGTVLRVLSHNYCHCNAGQLQAWQQVPW